MPNATTEIAADGLTRVQRLQALQVAVDEYVEKERQRLTKELTLLDAVFTSRTTGKEFKELTVTYTTAAAKKDLDAFLRR